tara:strand:- start:12426 stop:12947 length:522 start_codon:yes stop_codon:yes gene_type:complete
MHMNGPELATVMGHGKYRQVEVRRRVDATVEDVWEAITVADQVQQWWAPGQIDACEGGRVKLGDDGDACDGDGPVLDGKIKVFIPPHIFAFTWHDDYDDAGLVRFDLVQLADDVTQVTLVQNVPSKDAVPAAAGWHELLKRLGQYLTSGESVSVPEDDSRFRALCATYEATIG